MKSVIKALIAGAVIAAIGVIILIAGLSVNGWKFENIKYTMQTFTAENENTALDIRLNTGSLRTEFYDGDRIVIEYPTAKRFETLVAEDEGKISRFAPQRLAYCEFRNKQRSRNRDKTAAERLAGRIRFA